MSKPTVFNYGDYKHLKEENERLREENTNLRIRCRIAEGRPTVAYICDQMKATCMDRRPSCKTDENDTCIYTRDVAHAANFQKVGDTYFEKTDEERSTK